jgi:hypothetical protein
MRLSVLAGADWNKWNTDETNDTNETDDCFMK